MSSNHDKFHFINKEKWDTLMNPEHQDQAVETACGKTIHDGKKWCLEESVCSHVGSINYDDRGRRHAPVINKNHKIYVTCKECEESAEFISYLLTTVVK